MYYSKKGKFISITLFILVGVYLFSAGSTDIIDENADTRETAKNIFAGPCPAEAADNKTIINGFITEPESKPDRQETNTDHLTSSQITLLQSPEYNDTCTIFNNRFQEEISETHPDGSAIFELTYYKVGEFFFALITRKQPSNDQDLLALGGDEYIIIFDKDLEQVQGYHF